MGKKKNKEKAKDKVETPDRPGRKDLAREVERLRLENEALRARLDRIAEIASSEIETPAADEQPAIVVADM